MPFHSYITLRLVLKSGLADLVLEGFEHGSGESPSVSFSLILLNLTNKSC